MSRQIVVWSDDDMPYVEQGFVSKETGKKGSYVVKLSMSVEEHGEAKVPKEYLDCVRKWFHEALHEMCLEFSHQQASGWVQERFKQDVPEESDRP